MALAAAGVAAPIIAWTVVILTREHTRFAVLAPQVQTGSESTLMSVPRTAIHSGLLARMLTCAARGHGDNFNRILTALLTQR